MNKILIGSIIVLILLALFPGKSEPFSFSNFDQVTDTLANDADETKQPLIHLAQSNLMDNSVLTMAENMDEDTEVVEAEQGLEQEQVTEYNDRSLFISIGSILLFGILLLLPLHLQKF